jgi:hypothetical protein
MTLTNHILTGSVLAKFLPLPIAVPLAFASHFVLDALPHFDVVEDRVMKYHQKLWIVFTVTDVSIAVVLSVWLITSGHVGWWLVGLVAYSPDLAWFYRFTVQERFGTQQRGKASWFNQFHNDIQKYERVWGAAVELMYGLLVFAVLR